MFSPKQCYTWSIVYSTGGEGGAGVGAGAMYWIFSRLKNRAQLVYVPGIQLILSRDFSPMRGCGCTTSDWKGVNQNHFTLGIK